jgi:hypothetical protein
VSRWFELPAGTPTGLYDLLVSLYFDLDGNGSFTSSDMSLVLVREVDAVTVTADLIFADGFESGDTSAWSLMVDVRFAPPPAGGSREDLGVH